MSDEPDFSALREEVLTILAAIGEYLVRILGDVSGREAFRVRSRLG